MTRTPEFRVVALRDALPPGEMLIGDQPARIAEYWRRAVEHSPAYNRDVENFAVMFLNTRRRITGHQYVSTGTLDTILVMPREVFRCAIVANASAIILGHNHPSGDPTPGEADIRVTRDLIKAGQLLKIEVLDHLVMGHSSEGRGYCSLRELGSFYSV